MKHENKHLNIDLNNISVIRIQFIIFLLNGQYVFFSDLTCIISVKFVINDLFSTALFFT